MTIDQYQQEALPTLWSKFAKPSHRTRPEQWVGFGIFLLLCLGCEWLNGWLIQSFLREAWFARQVEGHWILTYPAYVSAWTAYYLVLSFSIWSLWRRHSLRVLKLEISAFFAQFAFQVVWTVSFFILQETLVALSALVLLWCNNILVALLFWKKERVSGQLLLFPFLWIFYVMALNMVICISNP